MLPPTRLMSVRSRSTPPPVPLHQAVWRYGCGDRWLRRRFHWRHVTETEPVDKVDGMQWLDATTSEVFIWDEDKWLQFPAGSEGGGSSSGGGASYPFTADGDISAGDPVYLKKSGRVANTQ